MMHSTSFRSRLAVALLLAGGVSLGAHAQQTPITGQMGAPTTPSSAAPMAPSPAAPMPSTEETATTTCVGDTTRMLLSMQRQGSNAGKALPIPGVEASASYRRYLKSFEHPIPEFYETTVSKNSGSGMGSSSNTP